MLTVAGEKHPADEMGRTLSQAGGILASLSNCHDDTQKNFEIAQPFVSKALKAIEAILAKANAAAGSDGESKQLLPVLESLRQDISRIRNSA